jgi:hypothetical protein
MSTESSAFQKITVIRLDKGCAANPLPAAGRNYTSYFKCKLRDRTRLDSTVVLYTGALLETRIAAAQQKHYIFLELRSFYKDGSEMLTNEFWCLACNAEGTKLATQAVLLDIKWITAVRGRVSEESERLLVAWLKAGELDEFVVMLAQYKQHTMKKITSEIHLDMMRRVAIILEKRYGLTEPIVVIPPHHPKRVAATKASTTTTPLVGGDAVEGVATPEKKRKQSNALVVSDDFYNDEEEEESMSRRKRLATGPFVPHLQQQQRPLVTIEFDGEIFDSVEACLQYASDQLTSLRDTVNYLSDSGAGHMHH